MRRVNNNVNDTTKTNAFNCEELPQAVVVSILDFYHVHTNIC